MATIDLQFATSPEKAVYNALKKLGENFTFQSQMLGPHGEKGSTIADFVLPQLKLIISVIGFYWHNRIETKIRDNLQRIALETQGWKVIYIDEDNALENATFYVRAAIRGVDFSRYQFLV